MWIQKEITLPAVKRGFYLVTEHIVRQLPELNNCRVGLLHLQLMHTSASISLNENADPDVRADLAAFLDRLAPDGAAYFRHTLEGPDDMSAHIKSSILGTSLMIAVTDGALKLGTWQGVYLGEHRDNAGSRRLVVTLQGSF
ncbi:MAG: YjbQ family protein [Oceanospirillaceae bacterium]|nr:YjbQ family protein [Oceanospirillaceae bacterium]MCP5350589.1 YjbQ family protein [Oceanospirillaceae bacterium]